MPEGIRLFWTERLRRVGRQPSRPCRSSGSAACASVIVGQVRAGQWRSSISGWSRQLTPLPRCPLAPGTLSQSTLRTVMLWKPRVVATSEIHLSDQWLAGVYRGKIGEKAGVRCTEGKRGKSV